MTLNLKPDDDPKLVSVRFNDREDGGHGYFPKWEDWPKHPRTRDPIKILPGETVELPLWEVKELLQKRLVTQTGLLG
jgi:hypothetical protein